MAKDRIELDKEMIPYKYDIDLGDMVYTLEFNYNAARDCFSVNLLCDGAMVCAGERLVYGRPLFGDCYRMGRYPPFDIVPLDEGGNEDVVNWATMNRTVFLTIDDDVEREKGPAEAAPDSGGG